MPKNNRVSRGRVRRTILLSEEVDKALGFVSVEKGIERGDLAEIALKLYLPTISDLPPVKAISVNGGDKAA